MATPVVHGNAKTDRMISFAADEHPRSLQIYGSDPELMGRAVHTLCDAGRVDHIDLNFGCPAAKVTRRGGGAAVPAKPELLRAILRAAVGAAAPYGVPVTAKFRMGLFDDWLTHLRTGEVCAEEGVAAIALHARTVEQHYSGEARWEAIARAQAARRFDPGARQRRHLGGRRRRADDGRHRVRRRRDRSGLPRTPVAVRRPGARAVGRPGAASRPLGDVVEVMLEHARLLVEHMGEPHAMRDFRKHTGWYLSGYPVGPDVRRRASHVATFVQLEELLGELDPATRVVDGGERIKRGHTNGPIKVALPDGWSDEPRRTLGTDVTVPDDADVMALSGG